MAYIDKTYISSYDEFKEIADWCRSQGTVKDDFGNYITPSEYIPHYTDWNFETEEYIDHGELTKEYIEDRLAYLRDTKGVEKPEILLWNTSVIFDIFLIRNCPVKFIQNRLKEQYGDGSEYGYEAIKEYRSAYDTYKREVPSKLKYKVTYGIDVPFRDKNLTWDFYISNDLDNMFEYDGSTNRWYSHYECHIIDDKLTRYNGNISKRKLKRLLKRWRLPKGTMISFYGCYGRIICKRFTVEIF